MNYFKMALSSPTPHKLLLLAMVEGWEFEKELLKIVSIHINFFLLIQVYKSVIPSQFIPAFIEFESLLLHLNQLNGFTITNLMPIFLKDMLNYMLTTISIKGAL